MKPTDSMKTFFRKAAISTNPKVDEAVLDEVLTAQEQTTKKDSAVSLANIGRAIMQSPITKLAAAAAIIAAVLIGINQFVGSGTSVAWADVLEQISNFRPYTCTYTVEDEGGRAGSYHLMRLSLTQRRQVYPNGTILVVDLAVPKTLMLVAEKKYAIERMVDRQPATDPDIFKMASSMQNRPPEEGGVQEIGIRQIEGRIAKGFRSLSKYNDITVWADVHTKLPVRVEIIHVGKARKIIMSEFKFDVDFDESLFSTTAPEGYTVEKLEKGEPTRLQKFARSTTEQDLIEGLRAVAIFLDREFPPEIELPMLQTTLREYIERNKLSESEIEERLTPVSEKWTKAYWYTQQLRGAMEVRNFHYAGEGVKLGDASTPVMWWLPKDSETYRVIYADLSARDVAPEELPD